MTKKILKVLKGSIKKWERIINGTGVDEGSKNCSLCQITNDCLKCIVYIKTKTGCIGTPYYNWNKHVIEHMIPPYMGIKFIQCPECKKLAKKELKFLKGLLPKG